MTEVLFTPEGGTSSEPATIVARKCPEGGFVLKDGVIIEYRLAGADPKSAPLKVRASAEGVVSYNPGTKRGDRLAAGAPLCTLAACSHPVVMKDMCATCGMNLREKDGRAGQRAVGTAASVPMIHNIPELVVSNELARDLGDADRAHCLAARKLVLLVDLDQTVIHTTNRPPDFDPKEHPEITPFHLYGGSHWTKLRPYTREFFQNLSALYEMHIVTFGQRAYAHKIAEIIDPDKAIFSHRILSRDEAFSQHHKTRNLAALFPSGEEMVAIIDDRPDVWEYSDALVQLRPYKYFPDVDDINAPPGAADSRKVDKPAADAEETKEETSGGSEGGKEESGKGEEGGGGRVKRGSRGGGRSLPEEKDEALVHVEKVLRKVHEAFYQHYDDTGKIRDLKIVISCLREQTLKGCVLVLSGVVPIGTRPERAEAHRIATKFGARVEERVDEQTTHVVAARWGTTKVYEARRLGVPTVTPDWLYACLELWEKAPEQPYVLTAENGGVPGAPLGSAMATDLANIPTMGKDLLSDMANEVDELSEGLDEEEDEEEDEENYEDEEEDEEEEGEPAWKAASSKVRAPEVARPKIDASRVVVKRKAESGDADAATATARLCPEARDRGYTGESGGDDDDDEDDFGGGGPSTSSGGKRARRNRSEDEEETQDYSDEDAEEKGEDEEESDDEFDDMAAELEHQLEH